MKDEIALKANEIMLSLEQIFSDETTTEQQKRNKATVLIFGRWTT